VHIDEAPRASRGCSSLPKHAQQLQAMASGPWNYGDRRLPATPREAAAASLPPEFMATMRARQ